jgi:RNA polymerase sigma factor (sigma-70 family)
MLDCQWLTIRPAPAPQPTDDADLETLLHGLPEKLRHVAWLYHVYGMKQDEVADTLNISRRTVVARLSHVQRHARAMAE